MIDALNRLWRRLSRRPWLVDSLQFVVPVVHDLTDPNFRWPGTPAFVVALVGLCWWRRRSPVPVFAALAIVAFGQWWVGIPLLSDVALLLAGYEVARQKSLWWTAGAAGVLEVGASLAGLRWSEISAWKAFVLLSASVLAAISLGRAGRYRWALAAARTTAAGAAAELARADERERLRQEVHDIVGHHLSVMIALVDGAAAAAQASPVRAAEALRQAGATGRRALVELRNTLVELGGEPDEVITAPGLADVGDLVERVRGTGRPVTLTWQGARGEPVPADVGFAAYRILQEALTNAMTHAAPSASIQVAVHREPGELRLQVLDVATPSCRPNGDARRSGGGGRGLVGMQTRIDTHAGTLRAGPTSTGWAVNAVLPLRVPGSS